MKSILKFSTIVVLFLMGHVLSAQSGDSCADAFPLTVTLNNCTFQPISNAGVGASGVIPPCLTGSYGGGDFWFEITLPPSGEAFFDSQGSVNDIPGIFVDYNLALYSGTCGALVSEGCNDNGSGAGNYPAIQINGSPGQVFYIQMWADNQPSPSNLFDVCVEGTATCNQPTASFTEQCAGENQYEVVVDISNVGGGATPLTISNDAGVPATTGITSTGSYTVGPFQLGNDVTITLEHVSDNSCDLVFDASDDGLGCTYNIGCGVPYVDTYCYGNNDNAYFAYTTDDNSNVTIDFISGLIQSPQDRILIYDGDPMTGTLMYQGNSGGNLTGLSFTANSGTLYLVVDSDVGGSCVDGSLGLGGGWQWEIQCDGLSQCEVADEITSRTTFAASELNVDLDLEIFSGESQSAGTGLNPDKWYTFTAVGSVQYFRSQGGATYDPVIEVWDECFGTLLATENSNGIGEEEFFWLDNLTVGEEYKLRVYHEGSQLLQDPVVGVAVRHIPTVQLEPDFCNITEVTSSDLIQATQPNPVDESIQRFQFEFTDTGSGTTYGPYDMVGSGYDPTLPNFFMSQFTDIQFGTTFEVRVRVEMFEGPNFGEWGPVCTLSTVSDFETSMENQFDGDVYNLCEVVRANPVGGASEYRWEFVNVDNGTIHTAVKDNRALRLDNVQPTLDMEAEYDVDVFATVNGFENGISNTKSIETGVVPETQLQNFFFSCGDDVGVNQWTFAQNVCGASSYTFRFTNQDGIQAPFTVVRPVRYIVFNMAPQIQPGATYDVDVRATINAIDGPYGSTCELTFIASGAKSVVADPNLDVIQRDVALSVYPNPVQNGEDITIVVDNIDTESNNILIEVYDLSGKIVYSKNVAGTGRILDRFHINGRMSQGVYLVQTRMDGILIETRKLFVK